MSRWCCFSARSPLHAQVQREVRSFDQFAGTWVLDEAASTGKLATVPRIPLSMNDRDVAHGSDRPKLPRLQPGDRASATPLPEVYRLDQTETWRTEQRAPGVTRDRGYRFTLVAGMLALTVREREPDAERPFTAVTDAYAVEGDVLTVHRHLTATTAAGEVLAMQVDGNGRHTFVYRRRAPETAIEGEDRRPETRDDSSERVANAVRERIACWCPIAGRFVPRPNSLGLAALRIATNPQ